MLSVTGARLIERGDRALHDAGDLRSARTAYAEAYRAAERDGDPAAMAAAALGAGGLWVHEHRDAGGWAQAVSRQRRALDLLDPASAPALRLRIRLAAEEDYRAGGHGLILQALREARQLDDPQTLAGALSLAHHCLLGPEHARARAALAEELLLTADRTAHRTDRLMGLLWRTVDHFLDGDPHAERSLRDLRAELAQAKNAASGDAASGDAPPGDAASGHLAIGFVVRAMSVMLTLRSGDFAATLQQAQECARLGEQSGDADSAGWYRGQLVAVHWFQGRVGELLPVLMDQANASGLSVVDDSLGAALAVSAASRGERLTAAGAIARLGRGDLRRLPSSSTWLVTLCGVVEAASRLGDGETAAVAYRLLLPHAQVPAMVSLAAACLGSVQHALGVAALTMGEPDRAVGHLRSAVRENLALGHWPAHCLSRHELARALAARDDLRDRAAARRERDEAQREADRLGMVLPWTIAPLAPLAPLAPVAPISSAARSTARTARPGSGSGSVRVRLLGSVDVLRDGTVQEVDGRRRKTVLAVLALHPGRIVTTDQLIDVVWGDQAPRTALNTLQSHISFLRRLLGVPRSIQARSGGYLLDLGTDPTDVTVAEQLIRRSGQVTDPDAIGHLRHAVGLWRGRPMWDIAGPAWVDDQTQRLGQLLLRAHQGLAGARLRLGQHDQLVDELEPVTQEHPLHEQLHEQLMLALYRAGLQSKALAVYERLRTALREELGIRPSRPLRDLHVAMLRQDDELDREVCTQRVVGGAHAG